MDLIKHWIIAGISLVFGIYIEYLFDLTGEKQLVLYSIILLVFIIIFSGIVYVEIQQRLHRMKYTVLIFVLDSKNNLLTVHNEYHKRTMIPCGSLWGSKTPLEAVKEYLKSQTGIDVEDCYSKTNSFILQDHDIKPYAAQLEFISKHKRNVALHYSFSFFLHLKKDLDDKKDFKFMNITELENLPEDNALFSDLLQRYRIYLNNYKH